MPHPSLPALLGAPIWVGGLLLLALLAAVTVAYLRHDPEPGYEAAMAARAAAERRCWAAERAFEQAKAEATALLAQQIDALSGTLADGGRAADGRLAVPSWEPLALPPP
jgi:hypothetical protein